MDNKKSYLQYAKELLILALPLIMGNIGFILIGAGDVFVAAKHSTDTLSSISIANAITNCIFMFGIGLIASVSPILSNIRGARRSAKKYFYPSVRFSMYCAFVTTIVILLTIPISGMLGFEARLVPSIQEYIFITAFATFGAYLHASLKEFLQAYEIVFVPNFIAIVGIFLNLIFNFVFVFGFGPIPSMGVKGLAIASLLVRTCMGLSLLVYCLYFIRVRNHHDKKYYKNIMQVGLPISFAILIEFIAFNIMAILMGRVSGKYAAAQSIIGILTTVSFMIPLALSTAIAVKVGFANGAKNLVDLKRYSIVGVTMAESFMFFSGAIFWTFPLLLTKVFTNDSTIIAICVPILYVAAIFQFFDGFQTAMGGIFKGIKKTSIVMLTNLICYWFISIPLGAYFAFKLHWNLLGFWIAIGFASAIICIIFIFNWIKEYNTLKAAYKIEP